MLISEFADVINKCGSEISEINGVYFHKDGWKTYSFPPTFKVNINKDLINSLKWKNFVTVILTDFQQKNSYEFILDTNDYSLDKFQRKVRNRIKKSLQNCTFKRTELNDLIDIGLKINRQTLTRQKRKEKQLVNKECWCRSIGVLLASKEIKILGAYYSGRLVGYLVAVKIDDKYCIQHAFVDRQDSEQTVPMNGLIYTLVIQIIKEEGSVRISYGLDSIKDLPELNRFKLNMLFKKIPVTRVYVVNPVLVPFIHLIVFISLRIVKKVRGKSRFIREILHIYYGHRLLYRELNRKHSAT